MKRYLPLLTLLVLVAACDKDKEESKKDTSAQSEKKGASDTKASDKKPKGKKAARIAALSPDSPTTKFDELPVFEDLEEEADRSVAIENLETELDRLEAEIVTVAK